MALDDNIDTGNGGVITGTPAEFKRRIYNRTKRKFARKMSSKQSVESSLISTPKPGVTTPKLGQKKAYKF